MRTLKDATAPYVMTGLEEDAVKDLDDTAHQVFPSSNAIRGNIEAEISIV